MDNEGVLLNQTYRRRRRTSATFLLATVLMMSSWAMLAARQAQASEWSCYDCRFDRANCICTGIAPEYCACCELN